VVWRRYLFSTPYIQAAARAAGGDFSRAVDLTAPVDQYVLDPRLVMDGSGNALASWRAFTAATPTSAIRAFVYDVAPPRLDHLSIPAGGMVGRPVSFAASAFDAWTSTSSTWSFGDGGVGSGPAPSHSFTTPGTHRVAVSVRDAAGNLTQADGEIAIAPAAAATSVRPRLTRLRVAPAAFIRRTRVSYRLNRPATVRFRLRGRKRHDAFTHASPAGATKLTLNRRRLGRSLRPGRYRLVATPVADGVRGHGGSAPLRVLASRHRPR
jgi:PKD domain